MSQYKISVIVSTYNTGNYLNEFLNSIKSQSIGFENIEVIFVDDKSTDNYTLDLLKDFNESYENVKVKFSDVNSGFPGKGRNTGLKLADSDYVIFADHDDTYTKNAFEVMYDKIAENDMLISNFNQVYPNKTIPFKSIYKDSGEIQVLNIDDDIKELIMEGKSSIEIRKAAMEKMYRPLIVDGVNKVIKGETNLNELNKKLIVYNNL